MKPARLNWIDYARGIAIILVLYRHVFEGIKESGIDIEQFQFLEYTNIFFFSFRMPLFFIVSGVFISNSLKKRGLLKFADARARMILYPYFVWGFLQLTLQMVFTRYTNGHPTISSYLHLFYLPRELAQFWYLAALFNVSILYALSKWYLKLEAIHNILLGLVLFYFSSVFYQEDIKASFLFDIFHNYIFFAVGDMVSKYLLDKNNFARFSSGKLLAIMTIPFLAAQYYFLWANVHNTTSKYMFVEYYQPYVYLLIAIIGCAFIINLTFFLQKKDVLKWLTSLGRHSLYIYVAHVIAFAGVRIFMSNILGIQNVPILLMAGITAGLLLPLLLYKLADRFNMRWIFTLEKANKEEQTRYISKATPAEALKNDF